MTPLTQVQYLGWIILKKYDKKFIAYSFSRILRKAKLFQRTRFTNVRGSKTFKQSEEHVVHSEASASFKPV